MQTFVRNTKTSRDILKKSSGKTFTSNINFTKVKKDKGINKKAKPKSEAKTNVYPATGSGSSPISSMQPTSIQKGKRQRHPGKANLKDKSNLTLCTACGSFVTSYSKELFINCSQQFVHTHRNRNEAA
jgi:hypothetical protein